jgi:hypothetical protein
MRKKNFIQAAHLHKGALHHQLGYGIHDKIPSGVLGDVMHASVGEHVHGHTVTQLMKKRAQLALTLRHMHHKKR